MVSKPHGTRLVNKFLKEKLRERILNELDEFFIINVSQEVAYDALNVGYGIYTPLEGFMTQNDYLSVLSDIRLEDDILWAIPIILDVGKDEIQGFSEGDSIILSYNRIPLALLEVEEIYAWNKKQFAENVFKTYDSSHPGVSNLLKRKEYLVGGEILLLNDLPSQNNIVNPVFTRGIFKERKWKTIVAFQTRNVPHIGHEYLIKYALNFVDGAFINPVLGKKKKGDWKDEVIEKAWKALFDNYFAKNTTFLGFIRYVMRYAGPREALHHAIMRKNLGATHFIIGRDHAGVGNYYGQYEAQEFVKQFEDELGIVILPFKEVFWCEKCRSIANDRTCPHDDYYRIHFSGTLIRESIKNGKVPPDIIFRREVYEVVKSFENPFVE